MCQSTGFELLGGKMKNIVLILGIMIYINACSANNKTSISADDPKSFAAISIELADNKGDLAKNTKLFQKYGYNLTDGTRHFNQVMEEIEKDQEKYKIYDSELYRLMLLKANMKLPDENDGENETK